MAVRSIFQKSCPARRRSGPYIARHASRVTSTVSRSVAAQAPYQGVCERFPKQTRFPCLSAAPYTPYTPSAQLGSSSKQRGAFPLLSAVRSVSTVLASHLRPPRQGVPYGLPQALTRPRPTERRTTYETTRRRRAGGKGQHLVFRQRRQAQSERDYRREERSPPVVSASTSRRLSVRR